MQNSAAFQNHFNFFSVIFHSWFPINTALEKVTSKNLYMSPRITLFFQPFFQNKLFKHDCFPRKSYCENPAPKSFLLRFHGQQIWWTPISLQACCYWIFFSSIFAYTNGFISGHCQKTFLAIYSISSETRYIGTKILFKSICNFFIKDSITSF